MSTDSDGSPSVQSQVSQDLEREGRSPSRLVTARADELSPSPSPRSKEDLTEADADLGAKHLAYDCSKSVAQAVGHPLKGPELVLRIWESTALSISKEMEGGKRIFCPGLGTFGFLRAEPSQVAFAPVAEFFCRHGLDVSSLAVEKELCPRVKHSVSAVARVLEIGKDIVQQALAAMTFRMGQEMSTTGSLAVSFAPLGCFICNNRQLNFRPQSSERCVTQSAFEATIPLRKHLSAIERKVRLAGRGGRTMVARTESSWPSPLVPLRPPSAQKRPQTEAKMFKSLPSQPVTFPDLLNDFSRTKAAPFTGADDPGSVSSRIATSFTKTARLTWKPFGVPARSLRWLPPECQYTLVEIGVDYSTDFATILDGSPMDEEIREAQISRFKFFEVLHRYHHYLETIPTSYFAPFSQAWTDNILRLVEQSLGDLPEASDLMKEMWQDVLQEYHGALRKVVAEHALSEQLRQRTGVLFVPNPVPLWGTQPFIGIEGTAGGLPENWESIANAIKEATDLLPCSAASLRLLDLWFRKYHHLRLVDLPEPGSPLLDLQSFCRAQAQKMQHVRDCLETEWLLEAMEILEQSQDTFPFTLLSIQLRSVVDQSIDAFVSFFDRFGCRENEAFLWVGLEADGPEIKFTTSLEEVEICLLQVFKNFVVSLNDLRLPARYNEHNSVKLWNVSLEETYVQQAGERVALTMRKNLAALIEALAPLDAFKHLLVEDARIKKLSEDSLTQEHVMHEVKTLRATQATIRAHSLEEIYLPMVSIHCSEINETLCCKAEDAIHILMEAVLRNLLSRNEQLCKSFEMVVNQMVKKPTSEMELVDLEMYVEEFRASGLQELLKEFDSIREWLSFLFRCENELLLTLLQERHFQVIYDSAIWVSSINERVCEREVNLKREREALESKFKEQRNKFLEDLEGYNAQVEQFKDCGNLRQVDEYLERIQALKTNFSKAHIEAEKLNAKERRFGWEVRSPFEQLKRGEQALEPYHSLWTLAYNMDRSMRAWLKGPLFSLDPAKVEVEVRGMRKEAARMREVFLAGGGRVYPDEMALNIQLKTADDDEDDKDTVLPMPVLVAQQLSSQAAVMHDSHLKLLYSLCNRCLQARHWEQISSIIGFPLEPDNSFTLTKAIEMELGDYTEELQELSDGATKEHSIELGMDTMEEEWRGLRFDLEPSNGTFVVSKRCLEELQAVVRDHQSRTGEMLRSSHVQALLPRLQDWEEWLGRMFGILKRLVVLQTLWKHLEPFFTGRDIYRQMPAEIQTFRRVDKFWRQLLQVVSQQSLAGDISRIPNLTEQLTDACTKLENIKQGLQEDAPWACAPSES